MDTRTYVSVGELATPTMHISKIGIIISVTNLVPTPSAQDRDTVTSHRFFLVERLTTRLQNPFVLLDTLLVTWRIIYFYLETPPYPLFIFGFLFLI